MFGRDHSHHIAIFIQGIKSATGALEDLQAINDPALNTDDVVSELGKAVSKLARIIDRIEVEQLQAAE